MICEEFGYEGVVEDENGDGFTVVDFVVEFSLREVGVVAGVFWILWEDLGDVVAGDGGGGGDEEEEGGDGERIHGDDLVTKWWNEGVMN